MRKFRPYFSFLLFCLLFISCKGPTTPVEPSADSSVVLIPPGDLSARFSEGAISLSWSGVHEAAEYYIYRQDGEGDFVLIDSTPLCGYTDRNYPGDRFVRYAVKSVDGIEQSELSEPSTELKEWVENLQVSVLEYSDRIRISWDEQPEAEEYMVYRFGRPKGIPEERARIPASDNTFYYEDNSTDTGGPVADRTYYYQVQWKKDDISYGSTCPGALGGFSGSIDTGEPENNDFLTLPEGNFIQDDNNLPLLFSFSDGEGGCLRDRDWYQYAGSRGDEVTIEISKPSVFDQIELQYFYEGDYSAPFIINSSHNPYEYIYAIPDPDSDQTPAVLYFSITPLSSVNENSFGPYSVCISSESFDPTEPVDPVDPADPGDYVQNPEASRLEYNDRIRLSWDKTIDVDEYVIYRGGSRSAAPVEIDRFSNTSAYIEYFDYTALADTHYYYQIRWMKGRVEYGSASPMVLGVRSDTTDIYEPLNNDFSTLNSGSYVPDSGNPPILYSFNDGDGLIEADTDWYRYEECKRGDMISVTVEKPIDFDQINLQFYHDGLLSETISIGSSIQEEFYPIPDPDNLREDTILFFRITPVAGISGNCIGSYSINVGNSL